MTAHRSCLGRAALVAAATIMASCSASPNRGPGSGEGPGRRSVDTLVVASFNFPESELLAEIYGQALEAGGIPVRVDLDLGTREMVLPAMQAGLVDVVPEYTGSLLQSVDSGARLDMSDPSAIAARLDRDLSRWQLRVLTPSPAQDRNAFVVTAVEARRYSLRSISDLAGPAGRLVLTGPPECPNRPYCLVGLEDMYGLHFARFVPLSTDDQRVAALNEGVADVALTFSTSPDLLSGDLVALTDDRHLQPADNVVPVVSARAAVGFGDRVSSILDSVSTRLTSSELQFLNWRVMVAARSPAAEAHGWLVREGLVARSA